MGKKRFLPVMIGIVFGVFLTADLASGDRLFSRQENRLLAQKPVFTQSAFMDGSYGKAYESWLNDQFPFRGKLLTIKTETERLAGRKDANGVYFAPERTLIERHAKEDTRMEDALKKADRLIGQAAQFGEAIPGRAAILLAPLADTVQDFRMPPFAQDFDQLAFVGEVQRRIGQTGREKKKAEAAPVYVDAAGALLKHCGEQIYYGTDHHWTTLGAFYGYCAFLRAMDMPVPAITEYRTETVTDQFYGTLHARVNIRVTPDKIEVFRKEGQKNCRMKILGEKTWTESLYFYDRLGKGDDYAFFAGGNAPLALIEGNGPKDKRLLLVKDSFANCMLSFLGEQYGEIYAVDERYYRGGLAGLVEKYAPTDILYVYDVMRFVQNYQAG